MRRTGPEQRWLWYNRDNMNSHESKSIITEFEVVSRYKDESGNLHSMIAYGEGVEEFICSPLMELALGEIATGNITQKEE